MAIKRSIDLLARKPWIIALVLAVALAVYLIGGEVHQKGDISHLTNGEATRDVEEQPVATVQIERLHAQPVTRSVNLYGRTQPDRSATLKAEVHGRVAEVMAQRGARVKAGDPIVRIELNDLESRIAKAKALLAQRDLEYDGAKRLSTSGFSGAVRLAEAEAQLVEAKANLAALELDKLHTLVKAPFDGILNERMVEVGDYLGIGDPVAVVFDIDPLVVRADVTEVNIGEVKLSQQAEARFVDGSRVTGAVRYISAVADSASNTFPIEVAIPNPEHQLLAGMSAELVLPLEQTMAVKVSPAVLALDKVGNIGVKTVENDHVVFTPIKLVKAEEDGIWLSGLGDKTDLITLGQGFVRAGDPVKAKLKQ